MYNYLNSDRDFYPKSTTDSTISYSYSPSDELILFDNSAMKIAMLLIMSEKVENLNFQITEKELFEELGQIGFVDVNMEIQKMRRNGKEILLQQTIIAIVSSWEVYFSSIIKKIFNDDTFISIRMANQEAFKKLLKSFGLLPDFIELVVFNKNVFRNLKLGTNLFSKRKVNFQNLETVKSFMKYLNINLVNVSDDWKEIDKIVKARHIIIHRRNDRIENEGPFSNEYSSGMKHLHEIYSKDKVTKVMKDIQRIVNEVDETLFTSTSLSTYSSS